MKTHKLEIKETAALLGITARAVQRLISLGKLPAEKVPRGPSGWKSFTTVSNPVKRWFVEPFCANIAYAKPQLYQSRNVAQPHTRPYSFVALIPAKSYN